MSARPIRLSKYGEDCEEQAALRLVHQVLLLLAAQLKQARKNQWRRRIKERQERRAAQAQVRAEAKERRRMRREAFFQSAYTRMAIGFFGILALYALLF